MAQKIMTFFFILLILLASFYLVYFIVDCAWFEQLKISYELVPVDAIGIIVSAALTLWIGWYIAKKLTEQRFEKEYLIKDLNLIETKVCELKSLFHNSNSIDISYVSAMNNEIQSLFNRLSKTIELAGMSYISMSGLSNCISELYRETTTFDASQVSVDCIDLQLILARCDNVVLEGRKIVMTINKD